MMDDLPPPWIAIPNFKPGDPATQGLAEAYFTLSFVPFWMALTSEQKDAYLDRWSASSEWREDIAFRIDRASFDADADLRESREWRAAREAERSQTHLRPAWRRFLGGED